MVGVQIWYSREIGLCRPRRGEDHPWVVCHPHPVCEIGGRSSTSTHRVGVKNSPPPGLWGWRPQLHLHTPGGGEKFTPTWCVRWQPSARDKITPWLVGYHILGGAASFNHFGHDGHWCILAHELTITLLSGKCHSWEILQGDSHY